MEEEEKEEGEEEGAEEQEEEEKLKLHRRCRSRVATPKERAAIR